MMLLGCCVPSVKRSVNGVQSERTDSAADVQISASPSLRLFPRCRRPDRRARCCRRSAGQRLNVPVSLNTAYPSFRILTANCPYPAWAAAWRGNLREPLPAPFPTAKMPPGQTNSDEQSARIQAGNRIKPSSAANKEIVFFIDVLLLLLSAAISAADTCSESNNPHVCRKSCRRRCRE